MGRVCINNHRPEHSLGNGEWENGCAQCEIERLRTALHEGDIIMGHDDAATEWRERWAALWDGAADADGRST